MRLDWALVAPSGGAGMSAFPPLFGEGRTLADIVETALLPDSDIAVEEPRRLGADDYGRATPSCLAAV